MPGITRVGVDTAGGLELGQGNRTVRVNGVPAAVRGDAIQPHGSHDDEHQHAHMVGASGTVRASGIPICRAGDAASCGHLASGSTDVRAG